MHISPQLSFDFGADQVASNDPVFGTRLWKRATDPFYQTPEWLRVRQHAMQRSRHRCEHCSAHRFKVPRLDVHHIIPRSIRPDLSLTLSNLQVLCSDCHANRTMQYAARHGWAYSFSG